MPVVLEQEKVVKLPIFCHSVIDDLPMSLEAFRMYAHLARKWGNGKKGALGSYVDMGEHCYRQAFPKASSETLRRKAIAAVAELQELNLLHKETRQGHDGRNLANSYILHDLKVIVSSHQGGCDDTRVVHTHYPSAIAPLEDTNSEDSPLEDSLPLTPSQGEGEPEREREDKPEDKRTGSTLHPLAADRDSPELLGKEDKRAESSRPPRVSFFKQPEPLGFEPINLVGDSCSAAGAYLEQKSENSNPNPPAETPTYPDSRSLELSEKEPPQKEPSGSSGSASAARPINEKQDSDSASVSLETNPPSPTPIYRDRVAERFNRTAALQDWEIRPGVPYPAFVKWRSQHYLKQGGHWADAALANARSEIRNNPQRAADLWSQFLEYSFQAADNALAALEAGMTPTLPSCFSDTTPVTKDQVMPKLEALAGFAQVALPQGVATPSCTASVPYMAQPNSVNADFSRVQPPQPALSSASDPQPTGAGATVTMTDLPQVDVAHSEGTPRASTLTASTLTASTQPSSIQPAGTYSVLTKTAGYNAAGTETAVIPQAGTLTPGIQAAGAGLVSAPSDGDSLTDYQEQEQNMRRLAQMIQSIKSMPKPQPKQPEPTNHFQKMRSWLQCDEPALRNEAIAWLYRCQDVEPVFDSDGNPYDFQEIEF